MFTKNNSIQPHRLLIKSGNIFQIVDTRLLVFLRSIQIGSVYMFNWIPQRKIMRNSAQEADECDKQEPPFTRVTRRPASSAELISCQGPGHFTASQVPAGRHWQSN